jgi:hypothetical protein
MLKGLKGKLFSFFSMLLFSINNTLIAFLKSFENCIFKNIAKINLMIKLILINKTTFHTNNI